MIILEYIKVGNDDNFIDEHMIAKKVIQLKGDNLVLNKIT